MMSYDVIVIGAGVVGSAVARELSRYQLKTAVLEKELDVACGNSSRNTGMLHAGFTYKPGSLKAECAVEGNQEFDQVAKELGVPFKRTGKLVVGFTDHDRENILKYKAIGEQNGVQGMRMIDKDEINRIDPNAGGEFAMYVPSSGILDPMQYTIGLAENACQNGVKFHFGQKDHLGTQPFSQLDLLSLICHTKASEHLNINFIWLYFILSFHASHLSFSLILCSASSFTQIVFIRVHVLKGKSNANVK